MASTQLADNVSSAQINVMATQTSIDICSYLIVWNMYDYRLCEFHSLIVSMGTLGRYFSNWYTIIAIFNWADSHSDCNVVKCAQLIISGGFWLPGQESNVPQ